MLTPQRLLDQLPQIGDDVQNKWAALAHDFVADIRGEPHEPYLTCRDGGATRKPSTLSAPAVGGAICLYSL